MEEKIMNQETRFARIRKKTGLSQTAFGKKYNIPLRTVHSWDIGVREPAEYILDLLERAVEEDYEL